MSAVRIFTPKNRLAKVLIGDRGEEYDELVARSEKRVESLADDIRAFVAHQISRILCVYECGEVEVFGSCLEISDAAMNIAETAGAAKMEEIGEVARGIRAMVDGLVASGIWHADALALHIDFLALLNGGTPPTQAEARKTLTRLQSMRAAIGIVE